MDTKGIFDPFSQSSHMYILGLLYVFTHSLYGLPLLVGCYFHKALLNLFVLLSQVSLLGLCCAPEKILSRLSGFTRAFVY